VAQSVPVRVDFAGVRLDQSPLQLLHKTRLRKWGPVNTQSAIKIRSIHPVGWARQIGHDEAGQASAFNGAACNGAACARFINSRYGSVALVLARCPLAGGIVAMVRRK
jgi:hypothetical protein